MDEAARDGLTRQQFARYYMMRLGIGHDLIRIALNPKCLCRLASEAELLALRPVLNQIEYSFSFFRRLETTAPEDTPGCGSGRLSQCQKQKTARSMQHPDRFLFLLLVLIFLSLIP
jgi:hypothetical protein